MRYIENFLLNFQKTLRPAPQSPPVINNIAINPKPIPISTNHPSNPINYNNNYNYNATNHNNNYNNNATNNSYNNNMSNINNNISSNANINNQ